MDSCRSRGMAILSQLLRIAFANRSHETPEAAKRADRRLDCRPGMREGPWSVMLAFLSFGPSFLPFFLLRTIRPSIGSVGSADAHERAPAECGPPDVAAVAELMGGRNAERRIWARTEGIYH